MMIQDIDRILIAVNDLEAATKRFSDLLDLRFDRPKVDEAQKLKYVRSPEGLELIQATAPDSVVAKFIEKRGEGLYGVILRVPDMAQAIAELQKKGLKLVGQSQIGGLKEAYFHPRDTHGFMLILTEYEVEHGASIAEEQKG